MALNVGSLVAYLDLDRSKFEAKLKTAGKDALSFGRTMGTAVMAVEALAPAMSAGAQAMSSLAAGAVMFIGSIAPAAGVIAAIPVAYLAVGQAAGVAKFAMAGVTDAVKALGEAEGDPKKIAAALAGLSPEAAKFATALAATKPAIEGLRTAAQAGLFPGMTAGLASVMSILPSFRGEMTATGAAVGGLAQGAGAALVQNQGLIHGLMMGNIPIITSLGSAGTTLGVAFLKVAAAAQPMTQYLAESVRVGAEWFATAVQAGSATGRLEGFFARSLTVASALGFALRDLVVGVFRIFQAGSDAAGSTMLSNIMGIAAGFRGWTESQGGRDTLAAWFARAKEDLAAMSRLVSAVGDAFGGLGGSTVQLAPLLDLVSANLVPALGRLFDAANNSGGLEALVVALSSVVDVFTRLVEGGGALTAFAATLKVFADAFLWITDNVPGASTALGLFFAAVGISKAVSLIGLGGAVNVLGTALVALGTKALAASLQVVAGWLNITLAANASIATMARAIAYQIYAYARLAMANAAYYAGYAAGLVYMAALTTAHYIKIAALAAVGMAQTIAVTVAGWATMAFSAVASFATMVATTVAGWATIAASTVMGMATMLASTIAGWASMAVSAVVSFATMVATTVAGWATMAAGAAISMATMIASTVAGWATIAAGAIVSMATTVATVVGGWIVMAAGAMVSAATMAAAWFIALGPIGWAIAAIAAVVVLVIMYWDQVKAATIAVWNAVVGFLQAAWSLIVSVVTGAVSTYVSIITGFWSTVAGLFSAGISAVVGFASALPGRVGGAISSLGSTIVGIATSAWSSFRGAVSSGIDQAISLVSGIPGRVVGALGNLGGLLVGAGESIVRGLITGIKNMAGAVGDAVSGVLQGARNLLPFSPAKEGPFSGKGWTLFSGMSISQALADGVTREGGAVAAATRAVMADASAALNAPLDVAGAVGRGTSAGGRYGPVTRIPAPAPVVEKTLIYNAAPGTSYGTEKDLVDAHGRGRMLGW